MSQETTINPKPHAQVILTQINIRHGLENTGKWVTTQFLKS